MLSTQHHQDRTSFPTERRINPRWAESNQPTISLQLKPDKPTLISALKLYESAVSNSRHAIANLRRLTLQKPESIDSRPTYASECISPPYSYGVGERKQLKLELSAPLTDEAWKSALDGSGLPDRGYAYLRGRDSILFDLDTLSETSKLQKGDGGVELVFTKESDQPPSVKLTLFVNDTLLSMPATLTASLVKHTDRCAPSGQPDMRTRLLDKLLNASDPGNITWHHSEQCGWKRYDPGTTQCSLSIFVSGLRGSGTLFDKAVRRLATRSLYDAGSGGVDAESINVSPGDGALECDISERAQSVMGSNEAEDMLDQILDTDRLPVTFALGAKEAGEWCSVVFTVQKGSVGSGLEEETASEPKQQ